MNSSPSLILLIVVGAPQFLCQMFGSYPYDYSSMFQGYSGYQNNPGIGFNNFNPYGFGGLYGNAAGFDIFGGGQQASSPQFNSFNNPFANNGLFNFGANPMAASTQNMFGANQFTNGNANANANTNANANMFGVNNFAPSNSASTLNNGNTMRSYRRRTQAFNYQQPNRMTQNGCGGGSFGGCGGGGWAASKSKA